MTMPDNWQYTPGWIDTTIHDFLATVKEPPSSMAYALVTCLDSCFDLQSIVASSRTLQPLEEHAGFVGNGLLLTTRRLLTVERRTRVFFGFDEVWFFSRIPASPKPGDLIITGPGRIRGDSLGRIAGWMEENDCSLALGDGTGMNFCARLRGIARYLVPASTDPETNVVEDGRAIA
jgi:hypothetical protein